MLTIQLTGLRFFAYHGLYKEEKLLGNEFELEVAVGYRALVIPPVHIQDTLNYVSLYELVKNRMAQREDLLETLVCSMAHQILERFETAEAVSLTIRKLQPPITAFSGVVGVHYAVKRDEL